MAIYQRSLEILKRVKEAGNNIFTKSGIMVGLGEKEEEVIETLKDLRKAGCDFLTIGQCLVPSAAYHPVIEYIHPSVFEKYKEEALKLGFLFVASGSFVISSYNAAETMQSIAE